MPFNDQYGWPYYKTIVDNLTNAYTTVRDAIEANNDDATRGAVRVYLDDATTALTDSEDTTIADLPESADFGKATRDVFPNLDTVRRALTYTKAKTTARSLIQSAVLSLQRHITSTSGLNNSGAFNTLASGNLYYDAITDGIIGHSTIYGLIPLGDYFSSDWQELNTDLGITINDLFVYNP